MVQGYLVFVVPLVDIMGIRDDLRRGPQPDVEVEHAVPAPSEATQLLGEDVIPLAGVHLDDGVELALGGIVDQQDLLVRGEQAVDPHMDVDRFVGPIRGNARDMKIVAVTQRQFPQVDRPGIARHPVDAVLVDHHRERVADVKGKVRLRRRILDLAPVERLHLPPGRGRGFGDEQAALGEHLGIHENPVIGLFGDRGTLGKSARPRILVAERDDEAVGVGIDPDVGNGQGRETEKRRAIPWDLEAAGRDRRGHGGRDIERRAVVGYGVIERDDTDGIGSRSHGRRDRPRIGPIIGRAVDDVQDLGRALPEPDPDVAAHGPCLRPGDEICAARIPGGSGMGLGERDGLAAEEGPGKDQESEYRKRSFHRLSPLAARRKPRPPLSADRIVSRSSEGCQWPESPAYSYRSDTIGSMRAAFWAGKIPKKSPMETIVPSHN